MHTKFQRQLRPAQTHAPTAAGPAEFPSEPASVQRAMFCSRLAGSESISVACERLTNAPDAGFDRHAARSSAAKFGLRPTSTVANA